MQLSSRDKPIVDGLEITAETAELLKATDSINARGEYRRWLHLWTINNDSHCGHIASHVAIPWVALWDKPELSIIKATYLMTDFVNFPISWQTMWDSLDEMIEDRRERSPHTHGPYWMLLEQPSFARLAGEMASMKRRLINEQFKADPECFGIRDKRRREVWLDESRTQFRVALEPFRVMSPQQELEDETARTSEERRDAVRKRNRFASSRPPRCR